MVYFILKPDLYIIVGNYAYAFKGQIYFLRIYAMVIFLERCMPKLYCKLSWIDLNWLEYLWACLFQFRSKDP